MKRFNPRTLQHHREQQGLNQKSLASALKDIGAPIHQSLISRYETGRCTPSAHMLGALSHALHVPVDTFYTEETT